MWRTQFSKLNLFIQPNYIMSFHFALALLASLFAHPVILGFSLLRRHFGCVLVTNKQFEIWVIISNGTKMYENNKIKWDQLSPMLIQKHTPSHLNSKQIAILSISFSIPFSFHQVLHIVLQQGSLTKACF